jgi:HAMP domain-containing protein
VRFESLVERFWYGITGAMLIILVLGAVIGWLSHRGLLSEVNEISRTAAAIVKGDLSRRVTTLAERMSLAFWRKRSTTCWSSLPLRISNWGV